MARWFPQLAKSMRFCIGCSYFRLTGCKLNGWRRAARMRDITGLIYEDDRRARNLERGATPSVVADYQTCCAARDPLIHAYVRRSA